MHSRLTMAEALVALADYPAFMSCSQVQEATGFSASKVRSDADDGLLRGLKSRAGRGGRLRFRKLDVAAWLAAKSC
jgi:hypothetical protein